MSKILLAVSFSFVVSSCGFLERVDGSKSSSSNHSNHNSTTQKNTPTATASGVQKCLQTFQDKPIACTELSGNYPSNCLGYGKEIVECSAGVTASCSWDFKSYLATSNYYSSLDWLKSFYKEQGINPDEIGINWEEIGKGSESALKEQCENSGGKYLDLSP